MQSCKERLQRLREEYKELLEVNDTLQEQKNNLDILLHKFTKKTHALKRLVAEASPVSWVLRNMIYPARKWEENAKKLIKELQ